jgi:4-hydroxybenzoate polyprenyltransferase
LRSFQKTWQFFIYSNLFIAFCAVLMGLQTFRFLLHSSPDWHLLSFIFFATICSYSFHWFLTSHSVIPSPRISWTIQYNYIHLALFCIGLTGAGIVFFQLIQYWHWLLLASIITFLYSAPKIPHPIFRALRKVALGKTIFLAIVWMYVTTVLPIVVSDYPWQPHYVFFILSRFFLIYAICILFDLRDREDDKANGIRSLITFLSPQNILVAFIISLLLFMSSTLWLMQYNYQWLPVLLLLIPGIIVAGLYNYAKTNFSDMLYYFILDGLMAFSAILMLITGI